MTIDLARVAKILMLCLCLYGAVGWWQHRPLEHRPGVLAPDPPYQRLIAEHDSRAFLHRGYTITPLADFRIRARVLSRENYRFDPTSDLSPLDLALGWGPMSDQQVIDRLTLEQSARWLTWRAESLPLPAATISGHSANVHIIPASRLIEEKLDEVRVGEVLTLQGYLVSAEKPGLKPWNSSLTRTDVGDGACEIFYVERLLPL